MKPGIAIFLLLFCQSTIYAQIPDTPLRPNMYIKGKCYTPIVPALVMTEIILIGCSYYAAKPKAYGDKVMGSVFALSSATMLAYIPFYWCSKENKKDPEFRKDRIGNAAMMLGVSYGFYRIAHYNLRKAEGDSFDKRFGRNLLEINAVYLIPAAVGACTAKILNKSKKGSRKSTALLWSGSSLGIVVKL